MDKRFIFRYRLQTIESPRGTLWGRPGAALEMPPPSAQGPSGSEARGSRGATQGDPADPRGPEKPRGGGCSRPYRRPTQVGGGKDPKVDGRPLVKELGKMAP